MNLRHWLQNNFRLRHLRRLSEKALARFVGNFPLPSLLPRRPRIVAEEEAAPPGDEAATDIKVRHTGREVRLLSSERFRVEGSYADSLAPLRQLSPDFEPEDLARALEGLRDASTEEGNFFPLEAYLQSLPYGDGSVIAWTQRCRASRQPAIDLLLSLNGQAKTHADVAETSALLIYGRAVAADER